MEKSKEATVTALTEKNLSNCPDVLINEFMPNPAGSDDAEWIELYNSGEESIDLDGWTLDDSDGGSRGYQITGQNLIGGHEYLIFEKEETGLALNNTVDSVRLINPAGTICSQIDYDGVIEGASYNRGENNNWFWSMTTTPDGSNAVSQPIIKTTTVKKTTNSKTKSGSSSAIAADLEKIREYDVGDKVKINGQVAVEPKILGKTIFYLAGSGVQIYSYKQDFPELKLGDYVAIIGALSESGGETRIKTATKNDIVVLEHREPPQPHELEIADINEDTEGWLATIQGEITEIHSSNVYVDDGTEEAKVYIKETTGIDVKNLSEGQRVKITGLVSQTKSGYRLLPRYPSDIEILASAETAGITNQSNNFINKQILFNYLVAAAAALAIIIIGLLIKNKKSAITGNSSQI